MFVMSYFSDLEAMSLATSPDGLAWEPVAGGKPVLWGAFESGIRDPFLLQDRAGWFHLFATGGSDRFSILHARSANLLDWQEQQSLPVMAHVPETRNCWAPECFYDFERDRYQLIWSSSITERNGPDDWNHRIWGAATQDLQTYRRAEIFFDPGFSVIDATVARLESGYLMAFKDERGANVPDNPHKAIRVCRAERADGPYTQFSPLLTPPLSEGPLLFQREGVWTMFYDHFGFGGFGALESEDGGRQWEAITDRVLFPPRARHAGVIAVSEEIGQLLMEA